MKILIYVVSLALGVLISLLMTQVNNFQCSNSTNYDKIKSCAMNLRFAAQTKENIKNFDYVISSKMQTDKDFNFLYRRAMVGCRLDNKCDIKRYMNNYINYLESCSKTSEICLKDYSFIKTNNDVIYYKE